MFNFGRLLEFFIIGIILGVLEDILAIYLVTGVVSVRSFWIAASLALPFAVLSELIVDHYKPFHGKRSRMAELKHDMKRISDLGMAEEKQVIRLLKKV